MRTGFAFFAVFPAAPFVSLQSQTHPRRRKRNRADIRKKNRKKYLCVAIFVFVRYNVHQLREQCGFDHCSLIWFFFILLNPVQGKPAAVTCYTGYVRCCFAAKKCRKSAVPSRIAAGGRPGYAEYAEVRLSLLQYRFYQLRTEAPGQGTIRPQGRE